MRHLAVDVLLERPGAGLHCEAADLDRIGRVEIPAGRAGRERVHQPRALERLRFLHLFRQVERVGADHGGGIRRTVRDPDPEQVLLHAREAARAAAGRGARAERRRGGGLLPGVAVALVVVAEVEKIQAAVDRARGRREAHPHRRAVAGQHHRGEVLGGRHPPLLEQDVERVAHPLRSRGRRGHRGVEPRPAERGERVRREQRHAAGRVDEHGARAEKVVGLVQRHQPAAARAHRRAGAEQVHRRQVLHPPDGRAHGRSPSASRSTAATAWSLRICRSSVAV